VWHELFKLFLIYTAVAALVAIVCAYIAGVGPEGKRKLRAYLIASLLFSSWICVVALLRILDYYNHPAFEFRGTITSVHVRNADSRRYSANLRIHTTSGGNIEVHVSDHSKYLRPGERVDVRYRGDTRELIKARFYSQDGKQEGVLQSSLPFSQTLFLLVGLFCVWASLRKYRRDMKTLNQPLTSTMPDPTDAEMS
jgi:hypothetical protein